MVYSPATQRLFITDPASNHVFVLDAVKQSVIATLNVPGAYGIDDTPDHSTLYVGTQIGDVYTIDAVGMTVTQRYPAAEIGPSGFAAYQALVMADGSVVLLGGQGGIPSVDGYSAYAFWNPSDNSIAITSSFNIGAFTRSPDRTKLIWGSIDSDDTICEVEIYTDAAVCGTGPGFIYRIPISPDGKLIVLPDYYGQAAVYDAHTLAQIAVFNVSGDTSSAANYVVSPDSKLVYVPSSWIIYAYDLRTYQQVGWFPNIFVPPVFAGGADGPIDSPTFEVIESGLLVGPLEEGVGFVDPTAMHFGAVGTQFSNGYLSPPSGPAAGGTVTDWEDTEVTVPTLSAVYFGGNKARSFSASGAYFYATSPPGSPGPVDIYSFTTDGGMQLMPEGFSYGPTVVQVTPDTATAEGGGTGIIYGYGFGPAGSSTTIPAGLHVTVGGAAATITAYQPNAYGELTGSPPFPLQAAVYTVPPGTVGSADIQVTTSSGTTTASGAMTYLPAIQSFPLSGSVLAQGIYNPYLDVYYFTDTAKLQVFSETQGAWQSPISLPGAQRLWGIALSPDGTKLAVSDMTANVIYLLNPSNPSSVSTFSVASSAIGYVTNPCGVAVSDTGFVYYAGFTPGISGYQSIFKLNTATGAITDYEIDGATPVTDRYLRLLISADNSRVYFNVDGQVFTITTATDKVSNAPDDTGCCYGDYDMALSSDQTRFEATGYFYDANLNAESYFGLNIREQLNISYVYGNKLSPGGLLLFQPTTIGIDVMDGSIGTLRNRISLPVSLSTNYDALVADGKDNILVAITGSGDGIAVIDLSSVTEPAPLPYARSARSSRAMPVPARSRLRSNKSAPTQHAVSSSPPWHKVPHLITALSGGRPKAAPRE